MRLLAKDGGAFGQGQMWLLAKDASAFGQITARQTRCIPLPLVALWGGVRGGGSAILSQVAPSLSHRTTPLPNPPPQGGREHTESAAAASRRNLTPARRDRSWPPHRAAARGGWRRRRRRQAAARSGGRDKTAPARARARA